MTAGKWFELKRERDPDRLPYSWPEATRLMWKNRVKARAGLGLRKTMEKLKGVRQIDPTPAIFIVFPGDYAMSGHLASIRKVRENLQMINFECWRTGVPMATPGRYFNTDMVIVWTKFVLRKLAEQSPLFAPIWADLRDLPADACGIYLADAPPPAWLASIRADEERLFAAFRDTRNLDMIGLDLRKPDDEITQQLDRAMDLLMAEKFEEADALLKDLLARRPDVWRGYWDLARIALWQGDHRRALTVIRPAQRRYPDALNFDRMAAECAIRLQDWALAERHLKRLWGLNPWDPNLLVRYAGVAFGQNDYVLAAKLYEDCMECGPLSVSARIDYGAALSKIGRSREAVELFKMLEKEDPANPVVLNNIGFILASEGQPAEAREYCSRALEMEPKRESFWDSMGFVQMKSGDYREAARSFLTAVELNPTFPDAWRHLLHVYHKEGQTDRLAGAKSYVARILPDQLARFEREQGAEIAD